GPPRRPPPPPPRPAGALPCGHSRIASAAFDRLADRIRNQPSDRSPLAAVLTDATRGDVECRDRHELDPGSRAPMSGLAPARLEHEPIADHGGRTGLEVVEPSRRP